jgi:hypothetical protein
LKEIHCRINHAHQVLGRIEAIEVHHSVVEITSPVTIIRAIPGHGWREEDQSDFCFEMWAWAEHPSAQQTICLFGVDPSHYLELTTLWSCLLWAEPGTFWSPGLNLFMVQYRRFLIFN